MFLQIIIMVIFKYSSILNFKSMVSDSSRELILKQTYIYKVLHNSGSNEKIINRDICNVNRTINFVTQIVKLLSLEMPPEGHFTDFCLHRKNNTASEIGRPCPPHLFTFSYLKEKRV